MITFALALSASVCWGISDFLGGLKARSVALPVVLGVSQFTGLIGLTVPVLFTGRFLPDAQRLPLAVGAGLASLATLALLYSALARGAMLVAAPIAASGVLVPVLIGVVTGEAIGPLTAIGIALAVLGCVAASWEPAPARHGRRLAAGALLAVGAAVNIGLFLTLLDAASTEDPYAATFTMRLTSCLIILGYLAWWWRRARPVGSGRRRLPSGALAALVAIGLADALAEICFAVSARSGLLSVTSVLASLYPVVTVALALAVLGERLHWRQTCGAVAALSGVLLLAQA